MSIIEKALDKQSGKSSGPDEPLTEPSFSPEDIGQAPAYSDSAVAEDIQESEVSGHKVALALEEMKKKGMLTPDNPRSVIAEELRMIKRPLLVNAFGQGGAMLENGNLIMVASACPGEGKTFTAVNLAMSIAMEVDRTVMLVDADVARPSITKLLGIKSEVGLVDVLQDDSVRLSDTILRTEIPKLTVLPAGRDSDHSTELLASRAMQDLAQELSQRYSDRVIIFDSPPLLSTSQASVLAHLMGQVLMVVESEQTPQHVVMDALAQLDENKVVGMILNKTGQKSGSGYYGYGNYGT